MSLVVGIELVGSRSAVAVVEQRFAGPPHLLYFRHAESHMSSWESLLSRVATSYPHFKWRLNPACLALDGSVVFLQKTTLPVHGSPMERQKAAQMAFVDTIPCDEANVITHAAPVGRSPDQIEYLSAGAPIEVLQQPLEACENAGIEVRSARVDIETLFQAYVNWTPGVSEENAALVLCRPDQSFSIAIGDHGKLISLRSIPKSDLAPKELAISTFAEVDRTLLTMPDASPIDTFYVSGVGAQLHDALHQEAASRKVSLQSLSLISNVEHSLSETDVEEFSRYGNVALAAGLASLNAEEDFVNLRQGIFEYKNLWARLRKPLSAFLASGLIAALVALFLFTAERSRLKTDIDHQMELRASLWNSLFPQRRTPVDIRRALASELARMQNSGAPESYQENASCTLETFRQMASLLPKPRQNEYAIDRLYFAQERSSIEGTASSFTEIDAVASSLRQMPGFRVTPTDMHVIERGDNKGRVSFNLKLMRTPNERIAEIRP